VAIASITDQSSRRRLLAASIAVSTTATVPLTPSPPCRASRVLPCSLASVRYYGFGSLAPLSLQRLAASPLVLSAGERGMRAADCQRGAAGPEGQGRGRGGRGHGREPQPRARILGHLRRGGLVAKDPCRLWC
jgi:hypothetical protein